MTTQAFIAKWHGNSLSEKAGAQPFFLDLCDLLGVAKPRDPDNYCFERGATRTGAGGGWADHTPEILDEEILKRLLVLNQQRAALQDKPKVTTRR